MNKREVRSPPHTIQKRKQSQRVTNDLDNVVFLPWNVQSSRSFVVCVWKTTKQWSRWSQREEARQWDMFPEPTKLRLIVYLIESIWTQKSKSNTLTPNTNSQTYWPRETSHVTNGIILCVCITLAISVLQSVLKWSKRTQKKIQVKKQPQQSRNRRWIWSRDAAKRLLMCQLLLHQKARGNQTWKSISSGLANWPASKNRAFSWRRLLIKLLRNWMLTRLGLLKSGNLMNWWKIERGYP